MADPPISEQEMAVMLAQVIDTAIGPATEADHFDGTVTFKAAATGQVFEFTVTERRGSSGDLP